jgi:cell division septum initiation protein DivIVA
MQRLQNLTHWLAGLDSVLTWDQRLGRWANVGTVAGIVVTAVVWGVGWLFNIPWWVGLLLGLVAWVIVLNTLVALGRRATPATETTTATPAHANNDPSPTPPQTEPQEVEQLRTKLTERDQRIDELEQQLAANRPPQHFNTPVEVIETLTPAKAKEIEQQESENEELRTQLAEKDQKIDELQQQLQRKDMEDEHGHVDWGHLQAREIPVGVDAAPLRAENDKLREELEQTKQELEVSKAGERRKRIEKWRAEILNHHFQRHPLGGSYFAQTETYLEMQAHLPPKIRDRLEGRTIAAASFLGPAHFRGTEGDRRILLREVARIEKEWGVI